MKIKRHPQVSLNIYYVNIFKDFVNGYWFLPLFVWYYIQACQSAVSYYWQ